jgi:hypothetical protein
MADDNTYNYWAFISYSSQDKSVAHWLKSSLSLRKVPSPFRSQVTGSLRKFHNIFLDVDGAAAGSRLDTELKRALEASRHLIVVCSHYAAASQHVVDEIAYFKSLGRGNRVICLIASGVPNATDTGNPDLECFPNPLRYEVDLEGRLTDKQIPLNERPIGAALEEGSRAGRRHTVSRIIAGMLGTTVERMSHRRRRARWLKAGATFVGVLCIGAGAYWYLYQYHLTHRTFYKSFVRNNGIWRGIDEVSPKQARHMGKIYVFESEGRKSPPRKVSLINGSGICPKPGMHSVLGNTLADKCNASRACAMHFTYNQDGEVEAEILKDQFGNALETMKYTGGSIGLFVEGGFACSRTRSGIFYVQFQRYILGHHKGRNRTIQFLGKDRLPRKTHAGVFGFRYEYDAGGRRTRIDAKAKTDANMLTKSLYTSMRNTFDPAGNRIEKAYFGLDGRPTLAKDGYAGWRSKFDAWGNEVVRAYFGVAGKPILSKNGYAGWRSKFDARGNNIETAYFGVDGRSILNKGSYAGWRNKFDARGNEVVRAYFGVAGKPILSKNGYAGWRSEFDARGNKIETAYFGVDGRPYLNRSGVAGWRTKFDARGNKIETAYFGVDGRPILNKDSYAGWRNKFNARGNKIETAYFGVDGRPSLRKSGVAGRRTKFDARGNNIEAAFFGVDGKPILNKDGVAGWRSKFDAPGNEVVRTYFGVDGKRRLNKQGVAGWRSKFNARGNEIETAYFGVDGKLTLHKYGAAGWRSKFDARDNEVVRTYIGVDGKPILRKNGYAGWRSKFDARGNKIETAYFGVDERPILREEGLTLYRSNFNNRGQEVERKYYGLNGKLATLIAGYAMRKMAYDRRGNEVRRTFYDREGRRIFWRRALGNVSQIRMRYDVRDRKIEEANYGLKDEPIEIKKGFHRTVWRYNRTGSLVKVLRFDKNGRCVAIGSQGKC